MGKEAGLAGEYAFIAELNKLGIPYIFEDDWFDFIVLDQKVEVKSCRITIKNGKGRKEIGRFDFTDADNREQQFKENVWVCFILRHQEQHILMGLVKARKLEKKRWITLHKLRDFELISLQDWVKKYQKKH